MQQQQQSAQKDMAVVIFREAVERERAKQQSKEEATRLMNFEVSEDQRKVKNDFMLGFADLVEEANKEVDKNGRLGVKKQVEFNDGKPVDGFPARMIGRCDQVNMEQYVQLHGADISTWAEQFSSKEFKCAVNLLHDVAAQWPRHMRAAQKFGMLLNT